MTGIMEPLPSDNRSPAPPAGADTATCSGAASSGVYSNSNQEQQGAEQQHEASQGASRGTARRSVQSVRRAGGAAGATPGPSRAPRKSKQAAAAAAANLSGDELGLPPPPSPVDLRPWLPLQAPADSRQHGLQQAAPGVAAPAAGAALPALPAAGLPVLQEQQLFQQLLQCPVPDLSIWPLPLGGPLPPMPLPWLAPQAVLPPLLLRQPAQQSQHAQLAEQYSMEWPRLESRAGSSSLVLELAGSPPVVLVGKGSTQVRAA